MMQIYYPNIIGIYSNHIVILILIIFSMFRVIPAQEYLDNFASDRSHMLKEDGVTYNSPPPSYPPIRNQSTLFKLERKVENFIFRNNE